MYIYRRTEEKTEEFPWLYGRRQEEEEGSERVKYEK
jgi:hypothetical protein